VTPHNAFVVPISDIASEPGARRAVSVDVAVDWAVDAATVGPMVDASLIMENASGTIVVRGDVATTVSLTCDRCLTQWSQPLEVMVAEGLGVEGDEDGYELDGDVVDLEPILRDALLLAIPLRPLCRDDCAGLCATCGGDLNTGACPGHDGEDTTPFAVLRDLLEP
jgi:uncharacterized protein